MLGGADNPNGELPSYITGANITIQHMPRSPSTIATLISFSILFSTTPQSKS